MSFFQSIIKNVLTLTKGVRKTAEKVAVAGAKTAGTTLERGATFFKNIAERYEEASPAPVAEAVTAVEEASPAPVAEAVTAVEEASPAPVAEAVTAVEEASPAPVAEAVTAVEEVTRTEASDGLNENTVAVYRAIMEGFNQNGETPSQGKLAEMTGFSKSTVSRHVGLLEEGGYIKRADDKSRKIILTDKKLSA